MASSYGFHYALRGERQLAHAHAERIVERVGDRGRGGALGSFSRPEGGKVVVQKKNFHAGHFAELEDRVVLPVHRAQAPLLLQRPARRLDGAAFELVRHAAFGWEGWADVWNYAALVAFGLLAFYALLVLAPAAAGERTGQVFYVWFSVFNLFATMLFWALMADRFTLEQSKRLFGAIAVGGTLGALFGPWLASLLARPLGTPALLAIGAGFLVLALAAAWWLASFSTNVRQDGNFREEQRIGGSAWEGFQAVFRSPYLLAICAYVLILAVMATLLYFTRLQMVAALGTYLWIFWYTSASPRRRMTGLRGGGWLRR